MNKVILSAAVILALVCAWFGVNRISIAARNSSRIDAGRSGLSALEPTRTERSGKVDGSGRPESSLRTAIDAVRAAGTILEIVDPDGRTAAVTSVVIARDGQPVRDCETDSKGRLELETSGETVRVYVLRPRTMPFRAEITLDGSEHRVVLPLGQEVSGRVRVDRKPPERPLRIRLAFADLPFPGSQERSEIARRLGCEEYEGFVLPEETQADGSFRWSGLPVDWSGTICFPFQYTLSTAPPRCFGDQWLGLDEPAVGLSVDLDTLPALRGRVVDDSTGAAIPKAQVSYEIKWAGLDSTTECGATADDSGRFVIPLQQPDLEHVEITLLRDARGRGRARSGQHWESIRAPLDLGDVMIQRPQGRELAFVVQDASGRPIAGALGFVGGGASRPTDQEGRGLLESVPVETHRFQLRARGFWSRTVEISDPIDGPIVVALEAGNQLSVEVTGLEVGSLRQPAMQLVSGSPLFVNSGGWLPEWPMSEVLTGFCRSAQFENEDRKQGIAQCSLDETGRFVVEDLKPGEPITLRILGPFDRILHEEAVAPLGPTERRQLSIRLEGGPSDLRGRVRSDDGASIARAKVLIVDRDGRRDSRTTGRDGEFGFPGVPEGEYRLSAEKRGWVPSETALVLAGAGNPQTEIRMQRGHDLTVEVLDSHGALVPPALVLARDPATDHVWQGHEDRAGRIHIYDLPPISCALSVTVAGDVIERVHDALVPLVRIEVPALGRVEVEWSRHAATDTRGDVGCQIALRPIDQAHGPLTHWTASTQQRGSYLFPAVFAGEYTVQLERLFQTDDNGSTRPEPVGSPVRVFVESNQTAHVTL